MYVLSLIGKGFWSKGEIYIYIFTSLTYALPLLINNFVAILVCLQSVFYKQLYRNQASKDMEKPIIQQYFLAANL